MEDLTNIRDNIKAGKRIRSRLHRWSFRQLQTFMATGWYYCGVPNAVTYPTPGMPAVNSIIYITKRIIVKGN